GNYFIRLHARRDLAEADDVGKNDSGVIEMIRDVAFPVAQPCHDLGRQDVPQQVLGMPLLVLDLAQILIFYRSCDCLRSAAAIRARKIVGLNGFGRSSSAPSSMHCETLSAFVWALIMTTEISLLSGSLLMTLRTSSPFKSGIIRSSRMRLNFSFSISAI